MDRYETRYILSKLIDHSPVLQLEVVSYPTCSASSYVDCLKLPMRINQIFAEAI